MSTDPTANPGRSLEDEKRLAHVLYILHALAPFTAWLLAVIAIVLGMAKRDDVRGTWLDSHFRWQIRTFWFGMLWVVLCGLFLILTLGVGIVVVWLPLGLVTIWLVYRVARGWLRLGARRPMY